jgi:hypothetical protein
MIRTILGLCAREHGHGAMYSSLELALSSYAADKAGWDHLIIEAERQGVAPLLHKHINVLDFSLPDYSRRMLKTLTLRSSRSNTVRNRAMAEVLPVFQADGVDVLLVKGIALSQFIYSSPGYRPMRDIDLLVKKTDLKKAENVLLKLGFRPDKEHDIPSDYYHLVPYTKVIEGLAVSIELHHNLLPFDGNYPLWPYDKSSQSARTIVIENIEAHTLSLEQSLWYAYLHGFRAPLTYEEFRFIHVADIVNLVERYSNRFNWQQIFTGFPSLRTLLPCIHHITPWQDDIVQFLDLDVRQSLAGPGVPYRGWPRIRFRNVKKSAYWRLSKDTFWPALWWLQLYYGTSDWRSRLKARTIDHPRMLWRWVKAHWHQTYRS